LRLVIFYLGHLDHHHPSQDLNQKKIFIDCPSVVLRLFFLFFFLLFLFFFVLFRPFF
jgi:hypothetical protein